MSDIVKDLLKKNRKDYEGEKGVLINLDGDSGVERVLSEYILFLEKERVGESLVRFDMFESLREQVENLRCCGNCGVFQSLSCRYRDEVDFYCYRACWISDLATRYTREKLNKL